MKNGKGRAIGYWVTTSILALEFLMGGLTSLARLPAAVDGMAHLGYPAYFGLLLGAWKVLGAIAIMAPGTPRLKEWAYAGIAFDLTGAVVSILASGDGPIVAIMPLVFIPILIASWALRPSSRTLAVVSAPKAALADDSERRALHAA